MTPEQTKAAAIRAAKPEKFRTAPIKRDRLPDGARFDVTYNAAEARWSGTLTIGELVLEDKAGGVMTLLGVLDEKYRNRLAKPDHEHHLRADLACPACGTDSTVGCLERPL